MLLTRVRIQRFRSFVDAQHIDIESDVTALVGKNESGKTTILEALHRLKPANLKETAKFAFVTEYPRWRLAKDRREADNIEETTWPVAAWLDLDESDAKALSDKFPAPLPPGTECYIARNYSNAAYVSLKCPLADVIDAAAGSVDIDASDRERLRQADDVEAAKAVAKDLAKAHKDAAETAQAKAVTAFAAALDLYGYLTGSPLTVDQAAAVLARVPAFFYFSDYDLLPGEQDLTDLAGKITAEETLEPQEESIESLLAYAGTTAEDFLGDDYDARKAELQASALGLTTKVLEYWTQNRDLEVELDTELEQVDIDGAGRPIMHRILKILMRDLRHGGISTNFETRSAGFRWFFSFLAAFSKYQESDEPVVVLLDEPGTSLHGEAQRDFLRFIQRELGASQQVIYTTHSQFMIDPSQYEKLRGVEDRSTRESPDLGVAVTEVDVSADPDTLLPVQSALGYSVSQHLFLGAGRHLTVEGGSDFIYLQKVSDHLARNGRTSLDPRIAIIPLGSASHTPAFTALFARHMKVSVLLDGDANSSDAQRVYAQAAKGIIGENQIVVIADVEDVKVSKPDIEDLFDEADYLKLYNWAFGKSLTAEKLPATATRILNRIGTVEAAFDHALPAYALTDHLDEFFAEVQSATLERFEALIRLLNATAAGD